MMTKYQVNERAQLELLTIEPLDPQDHLERKLDAAIDLSFIYPLVEDLYSTIGSPSIDPVVLIKMTFIQYDFGIRSMRQTIKEIKMIVAYRWFLGFGFHTELPLMQPARHQLLRISLLQDYLDVAEDLRNNHEAKEIY